jgi:hypothetical protein
MRKLLQFTLFFFLTSVLLSQESMLTTEQWATLEITFTSQSDYENPYTDVAVWADFTNQHDDTIKRPAFWDGDNIWKIRFTSPDTISTWKWLSYASNEQDRGLHGATGSVSSNAYSGNNKLLANGLLKMAEGNRNVIQHSGKSFLVVADTPWAIPFRATVDQVSTYARDRQEKGFNSALLMSLQPDMNAVGPNERNTLKGFKRAFEDLSDGHINILNPSYFQTLDQITDVLINHEIVPVYQPVFHGFGWKGLKVLGNTINPKEYVRYCNYLLARYGSKPAIWLIGGDHDGNDPGVKESGEMFQEWDSYSQPTGLHYNPCDDYVAEWAVNDPSKHCMHFNKTHQDKEWLDFQWAQTGHDGAHQYHKVEKMYDNLPTKGVANGEPTYEGMNDGKNGLGWWQGEEAWMQLMHGGTMGIVYGAASLWQWKITGDEEGWTAWSSQPKSWEEALYMEGSVYAGMIGKILSSIDMTNIEKRWDLAGGKPLLAKPGSLYISYLKEGGEIEIKSLPKRKGLQFIWTNPKNGQVVNFGAANLTKFHAPDNNPWVLIIN